MFLQRPTRQGSQEERGLILLPRRRKAAKVKPGSELSQVEVVLDLVLPSSHTFSSGVVSCCGISDHALVRAKQLGIPATGEKQCPGSDLPFEKGLLFTGSINLKHDRLPAFFFACEVVKQQPAIRNNRYLFFVSHAVFNRNPHCLLFGFFACDLFFQCILCP